MDQETILKRLYSAFDPFKPLQADDPAYTDFQAVRGDSNVLEELGTEILSLERNSYQLYSGHRGAGKSTELLKLQKYLNGKGCFVVYFDADEEDIDTQNAQYTDILLACTRNLLKSSLSQSADPRPVLDWLQERAASLSEFVKDLATTKLEFEKLGVEGQIAQFGKLTATLKAVPSMRQQIRDKVNPYTPTLISALNQFIQQAKRHLPEGYSQLVVIADSLDRIVPIPQSDGRSNHEHIFVDNSEQLTALDCHVIYTVPISLVYSRSFLEARNNYGTDAQVLPMVMVRTRDGQIFAPGLEKLKDLINKRVYLLAKVSASLGLEADIFESAETLEQLCLMSGGHVRELLLLLKAALMRSGSLPISGRVVGRAISDASNTYGMTVNDEEWLPLARVSVSKQLKKDALHRDLLFRRCLLEYRYQTEDGKTKCWYDVHPLIVELDDFQAALSAVNHDPTLSS